MNGETFHHRSSPLTAVAAAILDDVGWYQGNPYQNGFHMLPIDNTITVARQTTIYDLQFWQAAQGQRRTA
jgi:hypothetical protein